MTYLSYKRDPGSGIVVAVGLPTIDDSSKWIQNGNVFVLKNSGGLGFNVMIFGAFGADGNFFFIRYPMFTTGWDLNPPGDFGIVVPQDDGTIAIQWPV